MAMVMAFIFHYANSGRRGALSSTLIGQVVASDTVRERKGEDKAVAAAAGVRMEASDPILLHAQ